MVFKKSVIVAPLPSAFAGYHSPRPSRLLDAA